MSPSQSYQTSLSRDQAYQDPGAPHDPSEGYHGGPELECVWPEPSSVPAPAPASNSPSTSRPSRPSFGAASTSSQQSVSSLRRPGSQDPDSVNDPVLQDPAPEEGRAVAEHPGLSQNGDSSPVSGDTHMIDADGDGDEDADVEAVVNDVVDQPSPSPSSTSSDSSTLVPAYGIDTANALTLALSPSSEGGLPLNGAITMPMSMLPEQGHQSYELLSYYLSRTANSMGNGSTDVNPFIAKLIPLAFSKPLVLQLILAQSAAHRQASAERHPSDEIAQRYYTDSLRMFRNVVDEYVSGNAENTLVLTVGSLIMCLTEVAKGDIHGTIFDHLSASKSLVSTLLTGSQSLLYDDLPDFLIEYYMHIAATSMISIDPQYNSQSLLSPDIEVRARDLVARKYVGQLCGCWLEILVLICQIFHLGQTMSSPTVDGVISPSPDNIVNFAFLQSQVMGFFPDPSVSPYTRLAGLVWKQAALLYLWTVLGKPHQQPDGSFQRALVASAVAEAITLLDQFPASVRINTSLCWPLAVIGCSTSDPTVQQVLRTRLQTMLDTIGLGNMRQTLVLLEHIWEQPPEQVSPWMLCRAMRERQIWISFA
ncbi:fungal-specific transcription factor domain-containing protein [Fusarium acuminatum]|uniref:Fungal-specific transcription factor domain-containing protein n=1 Tax=Fusarium acuminatum TaxID=5515 RepID=A0ABZ2X824_9HYPO